MKILGYDYALLEESDDDDNLGRCLTTKLTIRISPNLPEQQKQSTVLHEILEALNWHLQLGLGIDNKVIMPLEASLFQVLTDAGVDLSPLTAELLKHRTRKQ